MAEPTEIIVRGVRPDPNDSIPDHSRYYLSEWAANELYFDELNDQLAQELATNSYPTQDKVTQANKGQTTPYNTPEWYKSLREIKPNVKLLPELELFVSGNTTTMRGIGLLTQRSIKTPNPTGAALALALLIATQWEKIVEGVATGNVVKDIANTDSGKMLADHYFYQDINPDHIEIPEPIFNPSILPEPVPVPAKLPHGMTISATRIPKGYALTIGLPSVYAGHIGTSRDNITPLIALAAPGAVPRGTRTPVALPNPWAEKPDGFIPTFAPVLNTAILPGLELDPRKLPWVTPTRISFTPSLTLKMEYVKTAENVNFANPRFENRLKWDRKVKSSLLYLSALKFVSNTWGHVSELIDGYNVLMANMYIEPKPGQILKITVKSIKDDSTYEIAIFRKQRLNSLPLNAQLTILQAIKGDIPGSPKFNHSIDYDGFLVDMTRQQLNDARIGIQNRVERDVINLSGARNALPFLDFGNLSTWARRADNNFYRR